MVPLVETNEIVAHTVPREKGHKRQPQCYDLSRQPVASSAFERAMKTLARQIRLIQDTKSADLREDIGFTDLTPNTSVLISGSSRSGLRHADVFISDLNIAFHIASPYSNTEQLAHLILVTSALDMEVLKKLARSRGKDKLILLIQDDQMDASGILPVIQMRFAIKRRNDRAIGRSIMLEQQGQGIITRVKKPFIPQPDKSCYTVFISSDNPNPTIFAQPA